MRASETRPSDTEVEPVSRAGTTSPDSPTPHVLGKETRRLPGFVLPVVGLLVILLTWELLLIVFDPPTYLMPRPSDIVDAFAQNAEDLARAAWRTTIASIVGLCLAMLIGVGGAIILGFSNMLERALLPYAIVLQATPTIAIAPLLVIWIGPGVPAITMVALIIAFFPMLANTLIGLNSVEPETGNLFKLYGASKWQTMRKLRLPGSVPFILAGVRISGGLSIKGAVIGEFVAGVGGGQGGLGYIVQIAARNLQTPLLFAATLVGASLGILYYLIGKHATSRLLSWHESADDQGKGQDKTEAEVASG